MPRKTNMSAGMKIVDATCIYIGWSWIFDLGLISLPSNYGPNGVIFVRYMTTNVDLQFCL